MSNLSSVIEPVNTAKGLPNEHYIDDVIFKEEKESVLFANWSAIGFAKDTPKVGDVNPITFLGMPYLLCVIMTNRFVYIKIHVVTEA